MNHLRDFQSVLADHLLENDILENDISLKGFLAPFQKHLCIEFQSSFSNWRADFNLILPALASFTCSTAWSKPKSIRSFSLVKG